MIAGTRRTGWAKGMRNCDFPFVASFVVSFVDKDYDKDYDKVSQRSGATGPRRAGCNEAMRPRRMSNTQQGISNAQVQTDSDLERWALSVGCWMLDVHLQ